MIDISIHLPSVVIGFFIGYMIIAALWIFLIERDGGRFEQGWDCGCKYGREDERKMMKKEAQNETD